MAYPQGNNLLNFFTPIMTIAANNTKPLCAINIAAANATHGEFVCTTPCVIRRAGAVVVLATVSTSTNPVITLKKYTAPAAGGTATTIDTITVPDATAVGKVYYVDNLSTQFQVGDVLQISHTLGTGGSVAGEVVMIANCEHSPESPANNTDMVVSV